MFLQLYSNMDYTANVHQALLQKKFILLQELQSGNRMGEAKKFMFQYGLHNPSVVVLSVTLFSPIANEVFTGIVTMSDLLAIKRSHLDYQIKHSTPLGIMDGEINIEDFKEAIKKFPAKKVPEFEQRPLVARDFHVKGQPQANFASKKQSKPTPKTTAAKQPNPISKPLIIQNKKTKALQASQKLPRLNSDKEGNKILSKVKIEPVNKPLKVKYSTSDEEGGEFEEEDVRGDDHDLLVKSSETAESASGSGKKQIIEKVQKMDIEEEDPEEEYIRFLAAKRAQQKPENKPTNIQKVQKPKAASNTHAQQPAKQKHVKNAQVGGKPPANNTTLLNFFKKQ